MTDQRKICEKNKPSLGVILPTLNSEPGLETVLAALGEATCLFDLDVIVADGGSTDRTVDIAQRSDARVLEAEGGWQAQVHAACRLILGQWVMILGADMQLRPGWSSNLRLFVDAAGAHDFAAHGKIMEDVPLHQRLLRRIGASQMGLVLRRSRLETLLQQSRPGSLTDISLPDRLDRKCLVQLPYILQKLEGSWRADAA